MADPRTTIISERLKANTANNRSFKRQRRRRQKPRRNHTRACAAQVTGYKVGLFDLDFTSPSTHLILGAKNVQPNEDKGLIPPKVEGLEYMSLIYYCGDEAAPLRGADTSNALIRAARGHVLGRLGLFVIDSPPGIGDAMLDLVRLIPRIEFLIVTTPSQLAFETVKNKFIYCKS